MTERAWARAAASAMLGLSTLAQSGAGAPGQAEPLRVHCSELDAALLACDFRLADPADVHAVQASLDAHRLPVQSWYAYPTPRSVTAVLLLVDSSGSERPDAVGPWVDDAARVMEAAPQHVRFGLGVFDADLELAVPIGADRAAVSSHLRQLRPTDRPTELYRNALEAVRLLASTPADRRALLIFSDGTAEDRAYHHQDVVGAASQSGVMITGFGYPRSAAHAVALQSLRRLSEETGGVFIAAEPGSAVTPRDALATPFALLDSGGVARVDLTPLLTSGHGEAARIQFTVQTTRGPVSAVVPVALPSPPVPTPPRAGSPPPDTALPASPPPPARSPASSATLPWGMGAAVVAGGGAVVLAWLRLRRRRGRARPGATGDGGISGYLVFRDQPERARYALTQPTVRIGRQRDNDLVLDDASVSRHHAEIRRARDGRLTLVDLDSLNGVFVNERQVKSATLTDGDAVEIGDVRFLFTLAIEDPPSDRPRPDALDKTLVSRPDAPFNLAVRE